MRRYRGLRKAMLLLLLSLLLFAGRVEATDGLRGDECVVEADEVITEDFYFLCNTLTIYGTIDGDIIGLASEVTIAQSGRVIGGVWTGGGRLTIEGIIEDDVHFLGVDLDILGLARFPYEKTDIVGGGLSVEIAEEVIIPGDVVYYGYQAILNGKINGNVDFQGQALLINNSVAGRVDAIVGDQEATAPLRTLPLFYSIAFQPPGLRFGENGFILRDLSYEAPQRITLRNSTVVGGATNYKQAIRQANIIDAEQSETFLQIMGNYILTTARDVTALGLVGILALNFFSKLMLEPAYRVQTRFVSAFSWGIILSLLYIPLTLIVIVASILILGVVFIITLDELTILTATLMIVLNLGMLGGFFFLLAFLGRVITCFVVGFFLVRLIQRFWVRYVGEPPQYLSELWSAVIVGVVFISLLANAPLGALIGLAQLLVLKGLVAFAGLGGVFIYLRDLWFLTNRSPFALGRASRGVPPPPDDLDLMDLDQPEGVGMDNLPPGFKWFDD